MARRARADDCPPFHVKRRSSARAALVGGVERLRSGPGQRGPKIKRPPPDLVPGGIAIVAAPQDAGTYVLPEPQRHRHHVHRRAGSAINSGCPARPDGRDGGSWTGARANRVSVRCEAAPVAWVPSGFGHTASAQCRIVEVVHGRTPDPAEMRWRKPPPQTSSPRAGSRDHAFATVETAGRTAWFSAGNGIGEPAPGSTTGVRTARAPPSSWGERCGRASRESVGIGCHDPTPPTAEPQAGGRCGCGTRTGNTVSPYWRMRPPPDPAHVAGPFRMDGRLQSVSLRRVPGMGPGRPQRARLPTGVDPLRPFRTRRECRRLSGPPLRYEGSRLRRGRGDHAAEGVRGPRSAGGAVAPNSHGLTRRRVSRRAAVTLHETSGRIAKR
jgi:hypothetical protein